jgi:cytochrome c553
MKLALARSALVLAALTVGHGLTRAQSADRQARVWASSCNACHGPQGRSQGAIPALLGRDADALYRALIEFKTGQRPAATVMQQHTQGYSDEELLRIARAVAAQAAP